MNQRPFSLLGTQEDRNVIYSKVRKYFHELLPSRWGCSQLLGEQPRRKITIKIIKIELPSVEPNLFTYNSSRTHTSPDLSDNVNL
jgi:hypothetical protein